MNISPLVIATVVATLVMLFLLLVMYNPDLAHRLFWLSVVFIVVFVIVVFAVLYIQLILYV